MGLFSKSKIEKLMKYFKERKISLTENNNKYEFELNFPNKKFNLYPYFTLDSDYLSIVSNIKRVNDKEINQILPMVNGFNAKSKYFTMKIFNNVVYLEYNTFLDDSFKVFLDEVFNSLNSLEEDIDNI